MTGELRTASGRRDRGARGQLQETLGDLTLTHLPLVVSWIDVYARATCQPREVVVPLNMELMGTVAKQLVPSCVTVQRCGGCCPDDGLECVPTGQHQVRMQVGGKGSVPGWMLASWDSIGHLVHPSIDCGTMGGHGALLANEINWKLLGGSSGKACA